MAGQIEKTPYSIGYVELAYALQTIMTYGPVQNKDGNFVAPTITSIARDVLITVPMNKRKRHLRWERHNGR